ncbi:hypothetical protein CLAIMM_04899 [Cladophialophora immunda]|nr:hypothetical protein CLAIMM_04899 [Cladophialophora immunda]
MSPTQQLQPKGRRSGRQQVAPESKEKGADAIAAIPGPQSPQEVEEKEPKTPLRTEGRANDSSPTHGYHGNSESLGDDDEEAVRSGSTTNVTSTPANNLEEGIAIPCFHLDDNDIWQAVQASTSNQRGGKQSLAEKIRRKLSMVQDYQFLLEAVRCEALGKRELRDTCIRLYLLIRSYDSLPLGSDVEGPKVPFERHFGEYLSKSREEVDQLISQLQRITMPQTSGDGGDEIALSVSLTSYPLHPVQTPGKGKSKLIRRQSSTQASKHPPPSQASKDEMESGYHEKSSKWFSVGRVFTMLWHENATAATRPTYDSGTMTEGPYGQKIYSQIRRFAVVKQGHGCSWAIPINTYHERGTTRRSFNNDDKQAHAIIYMRGSKPKRLPEEPILIKTPIMVDGASEDKKLHYTSRIRFDKVFTIEHNVKVKNVGKISKESIPHFIHYWREQALGAEDPEAAPRIPLS